MDNVVRITKNLPAYARPWRIEGFNEIYSETPGDENHGFMIIAADGMSIVAQCLTLRNAELICDTVNKHNRGGED